MYGWGERRVMMDRSSAPLPVELPNDVDSLKKLRESLRNDMQIMESQIRRAPRTWPHYGHNEHIFITTQQDFKRVSRKLNTKLGELKQGDMDVIKASHVLPVDFKSMMPALNGPKIIVPLAKSLDIDISEHSTNTKQIQEIVKQPTNIIAKALLPIIESLDKKGLDSVLKKFINFNLISVRDVKFNDTNANKKMLIKHIILTRFLRDPSKRNPIKLNTKITRKISEFLGKDIMAAKKKSKKHKKTKKTKAKTRKHARSRVNKR